MYNELVDKEANKIYCQQAHTCQTDTSADSLKINQLSNKKYQKYCKDMKTNKHRTSHHSRVYIDVCMRMIMMFTFKDYNESVTKSNHISIYIQDNDP
jgi:hypothetical protein